MKGLGAVLLGSLLLLQGCAEMIIREHDSVGTKTAKVAGRVLLAIPTMLFSELGFVTIKRQEEFEASQQQAARSWQDAIFERQQRLDRAVGKLTLDEAIQRWGQPVSVVEGDRITSAVWRTVHTPARTMIVPAPVTRGLSPIIDTVPAYLDMPSHGDQVDCTFSKETGILETIRYSAW